MNDDPRNRANAEHRRFPGPAGLLHALDYGGPGEPALLVHGMGAHVAWWRWCAPRLAPGLRVAALDLRGHGDSDWCSPARYAIGDYAADIEAARAALGFERFYLIGHSLGARAALAYARAFPQRLERLALLDFLTEFKSDGHSRFERRPKRRQPSYSTAEEVASRFHLQPRGSSAAPELLDAVARESVRRRPDGRWSWKFDWSAFYFEYAPVYGDLGAIRLPALVARGEHSAVMPRADFERVLRELPGAAGVELPGAHHHLPLDAPEETARILLEFAEKNFARMKP